MSEILSSIDKEEIYQEVGAILGAVIFSVGRIMAMVAFWFLYTIKMYENRFSSVELLDIFCWDMRATYDEPIKMFFFGGIVGVVVDKCLQAYTLKLDYLSSCGLTICLLSSFCLQLLWKIKTRKMRFER